MTPNDEAWAAVMGSSGPGSCSASAEGDAGINGVEGDEGVEGAAALVALVASVATDAEDAPDEAGEADEADEADAGVLAVGFGISGTSRPCGAAGGANWATPHKGTRTKRELPSWRKNRIMVCCCRLGAGSAVNGALSVGPLLRCAEAVGLHDTWIPVACRHAVELSCERKLM